MKKQKHKKITKGIEKMLDNLYKNIGGKIKSLAKWSFVVEAIGSVIAGLALMEDLDETAILLIVGGPIVAWVGSWILYALGEMVSALVELKDIAKKQQYAPDIESTVIPAAPAPAVTRAAPAPETGKAPASEKTQPVPPKAPAATQTYYAARFTEEKKPAPVGDDTYVSGRTYYQGDRVKFHGVWYECTAAGSGTVWNPHVSPSQWKEISEQ